MASVGRGRFSFVFLLIALVSHLGDASVECDSTRFCQDFLHPASECVEGLCLNPFFKGGCLHNFKPEGKKIRVCNSDDPPDAAEKGYCRQPNQEYTEIRIASQNWESVFFSAWALQILLSEILDVPTTIESGTPHDYVNLYDPKIRMDYGTSNKWGQLKRASNLGDCRLADRSDENYEPCAHIIPEVWNPRLRDIAELTSQGYTEPVQPLGALGQQSWLVPRFTGVYDPSLLTHLGLSGEEHRQKLADTFLRPTTWADYCELVSPDNCESIDETSNRPPADYTEGEKFFVEGLYWGHFRKTDANNCTLYPDSCTGHLADYPCGWASFANAQAYHLDIALEAVPYSYSSLVEIWWAANYTKSHVVGHWWSPEILFQQFLGTDSEMTRISLPLPTQECVENRIAPEDRCSDDFETSVGDPLGACDEPPHPLRKVIASSLFRLSNDPDKPEGIQSPAYDAVRAFQMSDLQMGQIFYAWFDKNRNWQYDPREAVCEWVIENFDMFQDFVPRTHPRVFRDANESERDSLQIVALSLSLFAAICVTVAIVGTYLKRECHAIGIAQIEFLSLLLIGLVLVTCSTILFAMAPSNGTCVAGVWFFNIGYTLEIVPLVVKMAAINRLMSAAQQMRRVVLQRQNLFGAVFALTVLVGIYVLVWTLVDPFVKAIEYVLTDETTIQGETIVTMSSYCESDRDFWRIISFIWQGLLLLSATVLAFQTRKLRHDMNETNTLAILIYSHFFFVALRVATFFLESTVRQSTAQLSRSILLSLDIIATVCIYFVPKLLEISVGPTRPPPPTLASVAHETSFAVGRNMMRRSSFGLDYDDTPAFDNSINPWLESKKSLREAQSIDTIGSIRRISSERNVDLEEPEQDCEKHDNGMDSTASPSMSSVSSSGKQNEDEG